MSKIQHHSNHKNMMPLEQTQDVINVWGGFLKSCQEQHMQMMNPFLTGMATHFSVPTASIGDAILKTAIPSRLLEAQSELVDEMYNLWIKILLTEEETAPSTQDKRFRHQAWETMPYFMFLKEYYLLISRWVEKTVSQIEGRDETTARKLQFYTKQMIDAACPTNSPFTNPEVLE